MRKPLVSRLAERIQRTDSGCWIWTGRKSRNGYGRVSVRGVERAAHRVTWMLAGRPVFKGEHLDHLCRNRACVNPDHLEAVSPKVNTRRGLAGSGPRGPDGRWLHA